MYCGCSVATPLTTKPIFMRPLRSARWAIAPRRGGRGDRAPPDRRGSGDGAAASCSTPRRWRSPTSGAAVRGILPSSRVSRSPPAARWSTSSSSPRRYTASLVRPPERNTRTVVVKAWRWGIPSLDQGGVDVLERHALDHQVDRDDPRGELPEPRRRQPADEVLGEHRQALLGLVVAGEPAGQHVERLVGAVDVGHDVGPHLVVEQRLDPRRPARGRSGAIEDVAVGHHHPGAALAHLDVGLEVGGERPVAVELGLRGLGTPPRRRATDPPRARGLGPRAGSARAAARRSAVTAPYSSMLRREEAARSRGWRASRAAGAALAAWRGAGSRASGRRRPATGTSASRLAATAGSSSSSR